MHQAILAGQDVDESAKIDNAGNSPLVYFADLRFRGDLFDQGNRLVAGHLVLAEDTDSTVIVDIHHLDPGLPVRGQQLDLQEAVRNASW